MLPKPVLRSFMQEVGIQEFFGLSDIGVKRTTNEDVFAFLKEYGFFALADGMGGHRAGEIAAKEAISYMCSAIKQVLIQSQPELSFNQLTNHIKTLFENANDWIYRLSRSDERLLGMGTTLCSLLFLNQKVLFSHIGDSRVYFLREGQLQLITKDHSVYIPSKTRSHKLKKILTQVIGTPKVIEPEVGCLDANPNDLYLICSDGLSDYVKEDYIKLILSSKGTLERKANLLVETAKNQGSTDNITVVLIRT